jgi:hypothetical protein
VESSLTMTVQTGRRTASAGLASRARRTLGVALYRMRPGAVLDEKGYVVRLEDNLLPGIARAEIEAAFGAGAGQELEGKMRAPWSSSALAVNSFAPWQPNPGSLTLALLAYRSPGVRGEVSERRERDPAPVGVENPDSP